MENQYIFNEIPMLDTQLAAQKADNSVYSSFDYDGKCQGEKT